MMRRKQTVLFILIGLATVIILIAEYIRIQTGERMLPLAWSASGVVLFSTLLWRFWAVDKTRWHYLIQAGNPIPEANLRPERYLNMMVVAMIVGLIATISIYQNFFVGAGIYLVMQICLIAAYSGLLHLSPGKLRTVSALDQPSLVVVLFWLILTPLIYVFFVYNGPDTLIVAPYVLALGLMAMVVSLGLPYQARPILFRLTAALGAVLFFFSDAIIGHMVFVNPATWLVVFISPTYVLGIILLSHATLAWPDLWLDA